MKADMHIRNNLLYKLEDTRITVLPVVEVDMKKPTGFNVSHG